MESTESIKELIEKAKGEEEWHSSFPPYFPTQVDYKSSPKVIESKINSPTGLKDIISTKDEASESIEEITAETLDPFTGIKRLPIDSIKFNKDNNNNFLGQGAFGQVYKGEWNKRLVALKEIDIQRAQVSLGLSEEEVKEGLQWEVARLSTVNHPNLVQFYGLYVEEDKPYLVIEYCEGGDLRRALNKSKPDWPKRWQWALEITQGLAYLHHQGMLHRDLKAENILIDAQGRAKLADLGVAQVDTLLQAKEAKVVFKGLQDWKFAAPEALKALSESEYISTVETDIYALGIVFWQLVTGKEPKRYEDNQALLSLMAKGEREVIPEDCPKEFKELILGCWAYEPSKRFSIEQVLQYLNTVLPKVHPNFHWMSLCQQTDILIHPKRVDMLSYVPSLVTEHPVLEDLDTYWQRLELEKVETGKFDKGEEVNENKLEETPRIGNLPLKLQSIFSKFLANPNTSTLLLLGESGLGKTLSTYQLAYQLMKEWRKYLAHPHKEDNPYFPLFIRPSLSHWSYSELKDGFEKALKSYAKEVPLSALKEGRFLIIIDGYDECEADDKPLNLAEVLGIKNLANVKLLVTCRPNTVESKDLIERFALKGDLMVRYFLPFSITQLLGYLNQGLKWDTNTYESYQEKLQQSHSLRAVLRNPFVASLFVQSWEMVKQKDFNQLNRWQIYQGFIEHWINSQNSLLSATVKKALTVECKSQMLLESFNIFAAETAFNAFQRETITFDKEINEALLSQSSQLWLRLKEQIIQDSEQSFKERQEKLTQERQRRALLTKEDYTAIMQWRLQQFEAGSPLKNKETLCEFSHKSFLEYFAASHVYKNAYVEGSSTVFEQKFNELKHWPLNQKLMTEDAIGTGNAMLDFLAEMCGYDTVKQERLLQVVKRSSLESEVKIAAANAFTVRTRAGISSSCLQLPGIDVSGADLTGVILDSTNLQNAKLIKVKLRNAWLRNTDFTHADLTDVQFGERPHLLADNKVKSIAYSSDGRWIASSSGNDIILWDVVLGERCRVLRGHRGEVISVAISPDNKTVVSGSFGTIKFWDMASGQEWMNLEVDTRGIVAISSDGKTVVSGGYHGIKLWDMTSGQEQLSLNISVDSIAISPDNKIIVSGSNEGVMSDEGIIKIWDMESGQERMTWKVQASNASSVGSASSVRCVAISPDGKTVVSGSNEGTIKLWDIASGQERKSFRGHAGGVTSIAVSSDNQIAISGGWDNTIKLWDMTSGRERMSFKGHTGAVTGVAFSPDGKTAASGSEDNTIRLWDIVDSQEWISLKGHEDSVASIVIGSDNQTVISGSLDNTIKLWDMTSGRERMSLKGYARSVTIAISPDGKTVVSGSNEGTIKLWDIASGQKRMSLNCNRGSMINSVTNVAISPDNKTIVSGNVHSTIQVWDMTCGQERMSFSVGVNNEVANLAISPDGKTVVSESSDHTTIKLWDMVSGQERMSLKGHARIVTSIFISPDNKTIISGDQDGIIKLWDMISGQKRMSFKGHEDDVTSIAVSSDNQIAISGSWDNTIKLWDMATGKHLGTLSGYLGAIRSIVLQENLLITGSEDTSVKCWKIQRDVISDNLSCVLLWSRPVILYAQNCQLNRTLLSSLNIRLLKQKGAIGDPTLLAQDYPGWNALHLAVANNDLEQIKEALKTCPLDSQTVDREEETVLHIAVCYQSIVALEYLLNQGADAFLRNAKGQWPGNLAIDLSQKGLLFYLPLENKENLKQTPLHFAVENGYERVVAYLLKQKKLGKFNCDLNIPYKNKIPLLLAAEKGYTQIILLLLEGGATLEEKNEKGETAVHIAVSKNQIEVLKSLRIKGANLLTRDNEGNAPIHRAAMDNNIEILQWFLEQGIPVDLPNEAQLTSLTVVVVQQLGTNKLREKTLEFLLERGANPQAVVEIRLERGDTLLHWAAREKYLCDGKESYKILEYLLKAKVSLEVKNDNGETLIHAAVCGNFYGNQVEILKLLKRKGADLFAIDNEGNTPIHKAAITNNIEILKWFLEQGVPVDLPNEAQLTSLALVAKKFEGGDIEKKTLEFLLERGANPQAVVEIRLKGGNALLHRIAWGGDLKILEYLLKVKVNLEVKNDDGETPVHLATNGYHKRVEALQLLKEKGADLFAIDNEGNAPIHRAAIARNIEILKWFLEQGVPVDLPNEVQLTSLALVAKEPNSYNGEETLEFLLERGANPQAVVGIRLEGGNTLLHWAAATGSLKILGHLLNAKMDIEIKNDDEETPVHWAAYGNQVKILELLKEKGANLLTKNNLGNTLLHQAASNGAKEVVEYLLQAGIDAQIFNQKNQTPADLVRKNGKEEIAKLIEQHIEKTKNEAYQAENPEQKLALLTQEFSSLSSNNNNSQALQSNVSPIIFSKQSDEPAVLKATDQIVTKNSSKEFKNKM